MSTSGLSIARLAVEPKEFAPAHGRIVDHLEVDCLAVGHADALSEHEAVWCHCLLRVEKQALLAGVASKEIVNWIQ